METWRTTLNVAKQIYCRETFPYMWEQRKVSHKSGPNFPFESGIRTKLQWSGFYPLLKGGGGRGRDRRKLAIGGKGSFPIHFSPLPFPPPNKTLHTTAHKLYLYLLTESFALDLNVCNRPQGLHSVSMDSPVKVSDTVHLTAAYPSTPSPTGNPVIMSKYYNHLTSTGVEGGNPAIASGLITELNICDFAHQIASGLQHLESMNVS